MDLEFLFSAAVGTAITGAVLEQLEKVEKAKSFCTQCTQCGKEIQTGASFCSHCGANVLNFAEGVKTMYLKAVDYRNGGKYREAISILEKLKELDRLNPIIYMQLWYSWGKLAATQRNNKNIWLSALDRVFEYYEVILRLDRQGIPLPPDVLPEVKEDTKMFRTYKDIITGKVQGQGKKAGECMHKADLAEKAGNRKEALRCITKAIEVETNEVLIAQYHAMRAEIKRSLGNYAGALADCKIALKCERLGDKGIQIVRDIQDFVKDRQHADKTTSNLKSTTGRVRTRTKENVKKTRKRVV